MLLKCDHCFTPDRMGCEPKKLEFNRYEDWISHIICQSHQQKMESTLTSWKNWENCRSIVITCIDSAELPEPLEIVDFFSCFGLIAEFYQDRDKGFCILRIDPHTTGSIAALNMKINEVVHIGEVKVKLLRRYNSVSSETCIVENQQCSQLDKKNEFQFRGGFKNIGPQFQPSSSATMNSKDTDAGDDAATKTNAFFDFDQKYFQRLPLRHETMNQTPTTSSGTLERPCGSQDINYDRLIQEYLSQELPPEYQPRIPDAPLKFRHEDSPLTVSISFKEIQTGSQDQPTMLYPNPHQPMQQTCYNIPGHSESQARSPAPFVNLRTSGPSKIQSLLPKFTFLFLDDMIKDYETARKSDLSHDFEKLTLEDQLKEFMYALTLDKVRRQRRVELLQDLQLVLRDEYPNCCIYPFGSFLTGLGDLTSDVDIYVDAFGVTHGKPLPESDSSKLDVLYRCKEILKGAKCPQSNKRFCNNLVPIRGARVPVLRFDHFTTDVHFDLSFDNLMAWRNSEMVRLYLDLHPVVRPVATLIRYWGKFHELTGSLNIKNYALVLLIIVFLSRKGIVPPINMLQRMKNDSRRRSAWPGEDIKNPDEIEGWDTSFCDNIGEIRSVFESSIPLKEAEKNLVGVVGQLAAEFFEVFATTDFDSNVICTYSSEILPRSIFDWGCEEDLPDTQEPYKKWIAKLTSARRFNNKTCLCIQDPFILNFNMCQLTTDRTLWKFQVACAETAKMIKSEDFKSLLDTFIPLPKRMVPRSSLVCKKQKDGNLTRN